MTSIRSQSGHNSPPSPGNSGFGHPLDVTPRVSHTTSNLRRGSITQRPRTFQRSQERLTKQNRIRVAMFTLNNPTEAELSLLGKLIGDTHTANAERKAERINYIRFQTEKGEMNGIVHIQGYLEFTGKGICPMGRKFKQHLPWMRCHFDRCISPGKAIAYVWKLDTRIPGLRGQGGRARKQREDSVDTVVQQIAEGEDLDVIMMDAPKTTFLHHDKIVAQYMRKQEKKRKGLKIIFFVGPTGTGKSYKASNDYPDAYHVPAKVRHNGRWDWLGYQGQKTLISNEFEDSMMDYLTMLKFFDQDPFQVEFKGGNVPLTSTLMIFTSNKDPCKWYEKLRTDHPNKYTYSALERRFKQYVKIYDFKKSNEEGKWNIITPRNMKEFKLSNVSMMVPEGHRNSARMWFS